LAAVKFLSKDLIVPEHEGIWRGQSSQGFEAFAANGKSESRETTAFSVSESDATPPKLGMEGTVFFQEIGNNLPLLAIDPSGDHSDEDMQNHAGSWG
jgi:hypothetical protein